MFEVSLLLNLNTELQVLVGCQVQDEFQGLVNSVHEVEVGDLLRSIYIVYLVQVYDVVEVFDLEVEQLVEKPLLFEHVVQAQDLLEHGVEELL
jgi:hypothetical protein